MIHDPAGPELERELRHRFATRTERFVHGPFAAELLLPASPEALIDESEFNTDERLPYWAELWPAARALARALLDDPPPEGRVLELGAGIALPSLAFLGRGADVLATDYYADALRFAEANAARNGLPPLPTALVDWRDPPELGRFGLVMAADVLYERRNAEALASVLPRLLLPGGRVLLADPGRSYAVEFRGRMEAAGWHASRVVTRAESSPTPSGSVTSRIQIVEWRPAR